jgi:DNA polymerase-3 subunit epsilon
MLTPKDWTAFATSQEKLDFLKARGFVPKSQNYIKQFFYSGAYAEKPTPGSIAGYAGGNTLVIELPGGLHCINADYLQDMQAGHYRPPEEYIVLDLETTGLDPRTDQIIEFAGVRYLHGRRADELVLLIHPGCPIPAEATQVNGISDEMLAEAPPLEEALPRISAFLGQTPIVAHNASFDTAFLKTACKAAGLPFRNTVFDTLPLSKRAFPGLKSYSLTALKHRLSIQTEAAHRALPDVLATAELFSACVSALSTAAARS